MKSTFGTNDTKLLFISSKLFVAKVVLLSVIKSVRARNAQQIHFLNNTLLITLVLILKIFKHTANTRDTVNISKDP